MHYCKKEEDNNYSIEHFIKLTSLITRSQDFDISKKIHFLIFFTFDLYNSFRLWWCDKIWKLKFSTFFPPFWSDWMEICSGICLLNFMLDWNKSSQLHVFILYELHTPCPISIWIFFLSWATKTGHKIHKLWNLWSVSSAHEKNTNPAYGTQVQSFCFLETQSYYMANFSK